MIAGELPRGDLSEMKTPLGTLALAPDSQKTLRAVDSESSFRVVRRVDSGSSGMPSRFIQECAKKCGRPLRATIRWGALVELQMPKK